MEFRALGGQHLLGFQYNSLGSNDYHWNHYGGVYYGFQVKVTTSGERAIIYKKKDKHPYFKDKYVYSYFLLGSGQITDVKVADLSKYDDYLENGWEEPLSKDGMTELQLSTIMDWDNINNPTDWESAYFDDVKYKISVLRNSGRFTSIENNLLCVNMNNGTKLSNKLEKPSYHTPFLGILHLWIMNQCKFYIIQY